MSSRPSEHARQQNSGASRPRVLSCRQSIRWEVTRSSRLCIRPIRRGRSAAKDETGMLASLAWSDEEINRSSFVFVARWPRMTMTIVMRASARVQSSRRGRAHSLKALGGGSQSQDASSTRSQPRFRHLGHISRNWRREK